MTSPKFSPAQAIKSSEITDWHIETDVAIVGFGGAGGCAAIEAAEAGAKVTSEGGVLYTASCSAKVKSENFYKAVFSGIRSAGCTYQEIRRTGHALDHPITFNGGEYLKGVFCSIGSK